MHIKKASALWHIDRQGMLFQGGLEYNALHSHSTAIFMTGLYEKFHIRLRVVGSGWIACSTAVIPAGVKYELDVRGNPLAVYYLEPNVAGVEALFPLLGPFDEVGGIGISQCKQVDILRQLYEDPYGLEWAGLALNDLIDFSKNRVRKKIDVRLTKVLRLLSDEPYDEHSMYQCSLQTGLSGSRFQHLFSSEIGVPFRRYRAWQRLRTVIREVLFGRNLTTAAHVAGYFDQAHFNHHFRQTFGAAPGKSLTNIRII